MSVSGLKCFEIYRNVNVEIIAAVIMLIQLKVKDIRVLHSHPSIFVMVGLGFCTTTSTSSSLVSIITENRELTQCRRRPSRRHRRLSIVVFGVDCAQYIFEQYSNTYGS